MKPLQDYIIEKFKISKNININSVDNIDVEFIGYHNGKKYEHEPSRKVYVYYLQRLYKESEFTEKIDNIDKVIIKYWKEDNSAVNITVKYVITFILKNTKEVSESVVWESPRGKYILVEGPKELGNIPDECKLIKYMLNELI